MQWSLVNWSDISAQEQLNTCITQSHTHFTFLSLIQGYRYKVFHHKKVFQPDLVRFVRFFRLRSVAVSHFSARDARKERENLPPARSAAPEEFCVMSRELPILCAWIWLPLYKFIIGLMLSVGALFKLYNVFVLILFWTCQEGENISRIVTRIK